MNFKFLRTFAMNLIGFKKVATRPMRWVIAVCVCVLLVFYSPLPAFATVTQFEEYPGQMLYQSRQNLQDQNGNSWQVIAFKRIHPEGSSLVSLRVIGFSDQVEFDHTQPLTLTTSLGQTLTAKDISSEISQDVPTPTNVGEYDIKPVLSQLRAEMPLQVILPTSGGNAVSLSVPSAVIEEWQTVASDQ
jgi:hypothetical protein